MPGSVDPSRAQERLRESRPAPAQPDVTLPDTRQAAPPLPPQPNEGFVLEGITIEGNSVFTEQELRATYKDHIGLLADLATLQYIAGRITQLYQDNGYIISRALVPQQGIENGVAKIAIVEGHVSRVRFEGEELESVQKKDYFNLVEKIEKNIIAMRPLHGPSLEQQLLLMNGYAGVSVHAVLEPLPAETAAPGAVGMAIQIKKKSYDFNVSVDNFGSRFAGPYELTAGAAFYNNLVAFDRASFNVLTTSQSREVRLMSVGYSLPVTSTGGLLDFNAAYSTLEPGYTLKEFEVESKSYNAGIRYQQNIIYTRRQNLNVSAGLDFANISTDYLGDSLYKDRLRVLRVGAQYNNVDNFQGTNNALITFSQGLDFLGTRETGSDNLSRDTGHSDFTKVNANIARVQQIGAKWQLFGALNGQYAWDPLLSSEEFGYGGQAFGRAYDPSEITGDHGIAAAIELRYNGMPQWNKFLFQPFAFYDIGKVWKPDADNESQIVSGASAGIGLKFLYNDNYSGYFAVAQPLTKAVSAPQSYTDEDGPRILFQLSAQF